MLAVCRTGNSISFEIRGEWDTPPHPSPLPLGEGTGWGILNQPSLISEISAIRVPFSFFDMVQKINNLLYSIVLHNLT